MSRLSNLPYRFQVISETGGYIDGFRSRREAEVLLDWLAESDEHGQFELYDLARNNVIRTLEAKVGAA